MIPSEGSAREEHDSTGELEELRPEVKLVLERSQASMMNAMKDMMAEFTITSAYPNPAAVRAALLLGRSRVGQYPLL